MGTALTGLEIKDTYDSLIKVTDNGPLSGTLKALSDGLGNDSTLSLSTTAASIAGTLAVTGNATFDTSTLVVDAANNRVGIGTASPDHPLQVNGNVLFKNSLNNALAFFAKESDDSGTLYLYNNGTLKNVIASNGNSYLTGGNVGIGTSTPAQKLDVVGRITAAGDDFHILSVASGSAQLKLQRTATSTGAAYIGADSDGLKIYNNSLSLTAIFTETQYLRMNSGTGGIQFNGDTAAANALDDYEEGTWTMGVSFGGASVGVTVDSATGTYTKIGRQVTVNGLIQLTSKGSSTGVARVTGLPFTIANSTANYSAASLRLANINFTNQFQGFGVINQTTIALEETTILGAVTDLTDADFANNSAAIVSLTYFV